MSLIYTSDVGEVEYAWNALGPRSHPGISRFAQRQRGVGIAVPLLRSKLDLEIGLQGHILPGANSNPDFLRTLVGLEVHP